jgi:hypothetical protein
MAPARHQSVGVVRVRRAVQRISMHECLTSESAISPDLLIDQTRHAHSPRVVQSWPAQTCRRPPERSVGRRDR